MLTYEKIKFYNLLFPIWFLYLFPPAWLVVLPANLLIDGLIIWITLSICGEPNKKKLIKLIINDVWAFGFGADFIGTALMLIAMMFPFSGEWWYHNIQSAVAYNPFQSIYGFLWTSICVCIAGYFIYRFDYKLFTKKTDLNEKTKKRLCLSLAICTAPYLFFLPTSYFW